VDKTVKLGGGRNVWVLFRHFKKLCNRNLVSDDRFYFLLFLLSREYVNLLEGCSPET